MKGVYLHQLFFIKVYIEHFLLGHRTTKFLFPQRTLPLSDRLKITQLSSGESPQGNIQRKCAVCCPPQNTVSETPTSSGGREDALGRITCVRCGGFTPHPPPRRTSEIDLFELEIAVLIYSLKCALVQSLRKDINNVFSVPCGRFMSRLKCIYLS